MASLFFEDSGICIGRLSQRAETEWCERLPSIREVRVLAMVCRRADQDSDSTRRERYQVDEWEVPVAEVTFEMKYGL